MYFNRPVNKICKPIFTFCEMTNIKTKISRARVWDHFTSLGYDKKGSFWSTERFWHKSNSLILLIDQEIYSRLEICLSLGIWPKLNIFIFTPNRNERTIGTMCHYLQKFLFWKSCVKKETLKQKPCVQYIAKSNNSPYSFRCGIHNDILSRRWKKTEGQTIGICLSARQKCWRQF
jgi:hypothetical protein